jgi:glutamate mutase epsilon subunit
MKYKVNLEKINEELFSGVQYDAVLDTRTDVVFRQLANIEKPIPWSVGTTRLELEEIKRLKKLEKYLNTPTFISNLIDNYENLNNFERVQVKESIESITSRYKIEDCSSK